LRLTTFLISLAAAAAALGSLELTVGPAPDPCTGVLSLTYEVDGLPFCIGAGEARACICGDCALATSDGILELIFSIDSFGFGVYFSTGGFAMLPGLIERCALLTLFDTPSDGISNVMLSALWEWVGGADHRM